MFLRVLGGLLIGFSVLSSSLSLAQSEDERRKGFYQKQKDDKEFDQEREAGLKAYLKEQAEWEEQRKKDIAADKNRKKQESPNEDSPEYKADRKEKLQDYEEYETHRKAYIKDKLAKEPKNLAEAKKREEWALEEYGLDKERPRFDIAKRNMYGGKGSGPVSSGSSGNFGGSSAPSFPPPPAFDDFGGEGYVPPPFPPAESFDAPPEGFPPPPPPVPFPEGGGDFDNGYFPPPPPPMPAPMDGNF